MIKDTRALIFKINGPTAARPEVITLRAIVMEQGDKTRVWIGEFTDGNKKKGLLGFPGGQAKPGEAMFPALLRELAEETGLAAEVFEILSMPPIEQEHPFGKAYCCMVALKSGYTPQDTAEMINWQNVKVRDALGDPKLADFCHQYLVSWLQREDCPLEMEG